MGRVFMNFVFWSRSAVSDAVSAARKYLRTSYKGAGTYYVQQRAVKGIQSNWPFNLERLQPFSSVKVSLLPIMLS